MQHRILVTALAAFTATLASPASSLTLHKRDGCYDWNTPVPPGMLPSDPNGPNCLIQWCASVVQDTNNFKSDTSAPSADEIMKIPVAIKAMTVMKAQEPLSGSSDLTTSLIPGVYGAEIQSAVDAAQVPYNLLVDIIWNESKGHPLTAFGGLCQIGPTEYGLVQDAYPQFFGPSSNRYHPADNIMAAALYLRMIRDGAIQGKGCTTWQACYSGNYCLGTTCFPNGCTEDWCNQ